MPSTVAIARSCTASISGSYAISDNQATSKKVPYLPRALSAYRAIRMAAMWRSIQDFDRRVMAELGQRYPPTGACIRVIDLSANLLPGNYVYSVAEVSLTATIRLTQHA